MNTILSNKMGFKVAAAALMAVVMSVSFSAQADTADQTYKAGQIAASDYRYAEALSHFQAAAAQGSREAQRASAMMLLYGSKLYGSEIQSDKAQAVKLLQTAAGNGCEVSRLMLKQLAAKGQHLAML